MRGTPYAGNAIPTHPQARENKHYLVQAYLKPTLQRKCMRYLIRKKIGTEDENFLVNVGIVKLAKIQSGNFGP
jgi:hypothetical protein